MPFKKGRSGNPAGRRFGSRNKRTVLAEKLFDDRAGELTTAAINFATRGEPVATRVCMDRVIPRLRGRPLKFPLPELKTAADGVAAANAVVQGLAQGELTAEETAALMRAVRDCMLVLAAFDFDRRLARFEAASAAADARDAAGLANDDDDDEDYQDDDYDDDAPAHAGIAQPEASQ